MTCTPDRLLYTCSKSDRHIRRRRACDKYEGKRQAAKSVTKCRRDDNTKVGTRSRIGEYETDLFAQLAGAFENFNRPYTATKCGEFVD